MLYPKQPARAEGWAERRVKKRQPLLMAAQTPVGAEKVGSSGQSLDTVGR